jgi:hypothetical protein
MGFASVSLRIQTTDGGVKEELWRASDLQADVSGMVVLSVPLQSNAPGQNASLELAIAGTGSLETSSRRAALFTRLLDEKRIGVTSSVKR